MAEKILKMTIQFRRDTTENWLANKTVVPAAGEPCFDLDLGTLKIGDGETTYENLPVLGNAEISADGTSIVVEDGVFKLAGFDTAETGAQPRKNAEGNIEWVVPSTETTEGLQTTVAALQSDVKTLQDIVTPSGEDAQPLLTRVESLENKMDGTGEGTVDAKIDAKINEFAARVTDDGTVNTIQELITYVANHGGEVETIVADITALQKLVGDDSVADQIAAAMSGIEEGAQVNKIEAIKVGEAPLDIVDKTVTIPVGAGLKASEEVTVAEDGTLGVGTISVSKLTNDDKTVLILDGGASV